MAARGSESKNIIIAKLLETFAGSFIYDKNVIIPMVENGESLQIKIALTCAKTNVKSGMENAIPGAEISTAATPKAIEVLNQQDEELTTFEKMIVLTPVYFPTILMGTATIGCILGANVINKKNQAMLVSAYSYLDSSFKEYKDKVKDIFGEEGETRVREEIAKDKYIDQNIPESKDTKLFFDEFSGRYFESTLYDLQNAVYNINRLYALHGSVSINELYKRLNLPPTDFGEVLGWSAYKDWENLGYAWIDIKWELMTMPDDLECYAISFDIAPTEDFSEW